MNKLIPRWQFLLWWTCWNHSLLYCTAFRWCSRNFTVTRETEKSQERQRIVSAKSCMGVRLLCLGKVTEKFRSLKRSQHVG